jgi:uncharacterized protein
MKYSFPERRMLLVVLIGFSVLTKGQSYLPRYNDTIMKVQPQVEIKAYAFSLKNVRLLESPFLHAMNKDGEWLLSLEPDRLLSRVREYAGLTPKAEIYGGWENSGLSSHSLGHYLSALSLYYAASGESQYLDRINYILNELDTCQKYKGTGYIGGIPDGDKIFTEVSEGILNVAPFSLNNGWSPWYTVHKILAGLLDAYIYTGNPLAKDIAAKYADWVINTTRNLDDTQFQTMLGCEFGGINDALANVYAITGDSKYLSVAVRFYHKAVLDPLAARQDNLSGLHANTQIPKITGCAREYELTATGSYRTIADFFWSTVVNHHSYVNGGNSNNEHFGDADKLNDATGASTTESCNTYNMLKLTGHLFSWTADAKYADYYEKALYNHILASQNPVTGMVCYFSPLSAGPYSKTYSTPFDAFWCCVGTGWENHAKYAENLYFHDSTGIYINLYIPSVLDFEEKGFTLTQQSKYPDNDTIDFEINAKQTQNLKLRFRCPWWAESGMQIFINGAEFSDKTTAGHYAEVDRAWNDGDKVTLVIPMSLYLASMPDNADRKAFFYGPVLLCNQLGNKDLVAVRDVPFIVTDNDSVAIWTQKTASDSVHFQTDGVGQLVEADLIPMFRMHDQQYTAYFDFMTTATWLSVKDGYMATIDSLEALEASTSDKVDIGVTQSETDHRFQGANTYSGTYGGRNWRDARDGGWFSYRLALKESKPVMLVCTYWGSDAGGRIFDIKIDGTVIATQTLNNNKPNQFFDVEYPIDESLTQSKDSVTVRFQAHAGMMAGGVFGLKLMFQLPDKINNSSSGNEDIRIFYADKKLHILNNNHNQAVIYIFDSNGSKRLTKKVAAADTEVDLDLQRGVYIGFVLFDNKRMTPFKFSVV